MYCRMYCTYERNEIIELFDTAWQFALESGILMAKEGARKLFESVIKKPENVVEVGSATGGSACIIASVAKRLTLIEPDVNKASMILTNLYRTPWFNKITLITLCDQCIWPIFPTPVSLLFLDHEHTYTAVRNSLCGWKPRLMNNAIVVCHDYDATKYPPVKKAVDESGITIQEVVRSVAVCRWGEQ